MHLCDVNTPDAVVMVTTSSSLHQVRIFPPRISPDYHQLNAVKLYGLSTGEVVGLVDASAPYRVDG